MQGLFTLKSGGYDYGFRITKFYLPMYERFNDEEIYSWVEKNFWKDYNHQLLECELNIGVNTVCDEVNDYYKSISDDFELTTDDYYKKGSRSDPFTSDWGITFCLNYKDILVASVKLSFRWSREVIEAKDLIRRLMSQIKKQYKVKEISDLGAGLDAVLEDVVCKRISLKFDKKTREVSSIVEMLCTRLPKKYECCLDYYLYATGGDFRVVCSAFDWSSVQDYIEDYFASQTEFDNPIEVSRISDFSGGFAGGMIKRFMKTFR